MVSKREQSEDTVDETTVCSGWTFEIMGIYRIYIYIYGIWLKTWISFVESYPGPVWSCWSPCGVRQDLYKKWGGDQEDGVRLSVNLCCFKFLAIDLHRITNYFPSFCMFLLSPSSVVVVVAMYATCFLKCSCISQFWQGYTMYLCFKDLFDEPVFAGILRMLWESMGRTFSRY